MPLLPNQLTQKNWLPLLEQDDIDDLMKYFGGFADSIIISYECWGETRIDKESYIVYPPEGPCADQNIIITLHRQTDEKSSVQLLCSGIYEFQMIGRSENFDGVINLIQIEIKPSGRGTLYALTSQGGLKVLAIDASALYWRPTQI
jgi:hypothetical protein